ncbi:DEAD/DEAH box helicase [Cerasicoccus fimbriatus]|uniref:DEAD/DEAH box helicase n=1 Tax=Cerasicoccus fimbriatus TaxID=3014554 RepID=UPI0022B2B3D0|nr:DEAD/DEAH box helicase family protein [Cerasicoccus sp. TK19100]
MSDNAEQMTLEIEHLSLPALVFEKVVLGLGRILHQLHAPQQIQCSPGVKLKGRRKNEAWEYRCTDGARYLVTSTTSDKKREGYTGILLRDERRLTWLKHSTLENGKLDFDEGTRNQISLSWANRFTYRKESKEPEQKGLRPPQIGALHAIAAHWSLSNEAATIVMPTGTGKTETVLSVLITAQPKCMLVVVPSKALKDQTVRKFQTLGILPDLGAVPHEIVRPVVGVLDHQLKTDEHLEIFEQCNVVVAVVNSLTSGSSVSYIQEIAKRCSHLVLDEAHHVAARSWSRLKDAFAKEEKPILQFTATPFREDRSPLGGKVLYNYPLSRAQSEGYFLPINFEGVFEVEQRTADQKIAEKAVERLRADIEEGFDHRLLARCQKINRAKEVLQIYEAIAPDLNPVLVHSQLGNVDKQIEALISGESKIVVTVNMLSEGFDLPSLKVAAIHDTFKSLAVTLQFAGRFPRVGSGNYGKPTIIANTGSEDVSRALQGLYDEDANWDNLLNELQFEKVAERLRFEEFNRQCQDLGDGEISEESIAANLNAKNLNFRFNTVVYRNARDFNQFGIRHGIEQNHHLVRSWEVQDQKVVFFVTRLVEKPRFTDNRLVEDSTFNLYVVYHDEDNHLLHIGSSTTSMNCHEKLAKAVSGDSVERIQGEGPYRVFCKIESLMLQQVGLFSGGGARNHRYSMFAGADVTEAIDRITNDNAMKSNFFGNGFKEGGPIGIGCSSKGKIWGRDTGSLSEWIDWCDGVAVDLLDTTLDTRQLLENVLLLEVIKELPNRECWFVEWPERFNSMRERALSFLSDQHDEPFYRWEISIKEYSHEENSYKIEVTHVDGQIPTSTYIFKLTDGEGSGYNATLDSGPNLRIKGVKGEPLLHEYFNEYPPILSFTDHASLEGANFVDPKSTPPSFPEGQLEVKNWSGVDILKESRWKDGAMRGDSIQAIAMEWCVQEGFDVVVDDDGANEVADIVAVKEEGNGLCLRLLHCKYSAGEDPGARIKDVVEVSSQAVKNVPWMWSLSDLQSRLNKRDQDRMKKGASRFFHGDRPSLKKIARISQIRPKYTKEIIIVQPGISAASLTPEMSSVLGSADSYIRTRLGCCLKVWCSA